eukprot:TRINITY_DN82239_c0_g1_i1.p1 TRINITY_DN82239_c0_g1~~TRINITY_DN82239_c0_g1_i1.p1  ORF type:complete len:309 (-),score=86.00 TRINITY_DN82239_c0_g1_i1:11-892(-)
MDLGHFAEEVLDAVTGICGDTVVESHEQASHVLDALTRRPGAHARELAAVFGVSLEQFERCRAGGREKTQDEVYADLCRSDAIFTWNVLIQRINAAAHWKEEFREMQNAGDGDTSSEEEEGEDRLQERLGDEKHTAHEEVTDTLKVPEDAALVGSPDLAPAAARAKVQELLERQLDAPEALRRRLARRLEAEVFEHVPGKKDFTHRARSIVANLRRNTMLAAGYAAGRVPPSWLVLADHEALAPRMSQLHRRMFRAECMNEVREPEEEEKLRQRCWRTAKGTDLAPPAQNERF